MRDMSIWGLIKQLYRSDWAETKDATPWDCTFAAAEVRDDEFERFRKQGMSSSSRTWYRSYCMSYVSICVLSSILGGARYAQLGFVCFICGICHLATY